MQLFHFSRARAGCHFFAFQIPAISHCLPCSKCQRKSFYERRRGEPQGPGWAVAARPRLAPLPADPPAQAEPPLCNKPSTPQLLEKKIIQISSINSERAQESEQSPDTPASAHPMGAGAGSGCRHRVTGLPDALLPGFWAVLHAQLKPAPFPATQHCPGCQGTDKNQRRHNTHTGGCLRVPPSAPPAQRSCDRETVIWGRETGVSRVGELTQTKKAIIFSLRSDWLYRLAFLCPSSRKEAQLN